MESIYVPIFLFLFHICSAGAYETHCSSGERLHTPREGHDVCIPCKNKTFMDVDNHTFRHCKPCTRIENPDVEVLISACNSTHDSVIHCKGRFYRRRAMNIMEEDRCEKCTECRFPARRCEGFYDTVCCPPNHYAAMTPEGVFECKERPVECGPGQYFRTSSDECLLCPAGTFMSDPSHIYKECLTCEELSENNLTQAVITRPCSRTAPTLFGCKTGYFRDPTQESLQIEVPCTPCRICNRSLVDCDMFHDAVCDDEDRMVSTAPTNLTESIGDHQTTGIPESCHVAPPTQTSSYQINIVLVSEMLLYLLLSCMPVFKQVCTSGRGFLLGRILREVLELYRGYYLSLFIVSVLFRVLIFLYYNGYFAGFAQDDILTILVIVLELSSLILYFPQLNYMKTWSKSFWGIVCSGKRRIHHSFTRWLNVKKEIPEPQAERFIDDLEGIQITTPM